MSGSLEHAVTACTHHSERTYIQTHAQKKMDIAFASREAKFADKEDQLAAFQTQVAQQYLLMLEVHRELKSRWECTGNHCTLQSRCKHVTFTLQTRYFHAITS